MLDYFIDKGYISLSNDGDIIRLKECPSHLRFEENRDGVVIFIATLSNGRDKGISEPEDWEFLNN